jgi:methionyl-tRNA synthetase
MPRTPEEIFRQLGIDGRGEVTCWDSAADFGLYPAGTVCRKGSVLFPRLDVAAELDALEEIKQNASSVGPASRASEDAAKAADGIPEGLVTVDDFAKMKFVTAKVLSCEPVEGSSKLLKIVLDTGSGSRQVVSGIAKAYAPADLIGRNVIFFANLVPVKLKDVLSEGMLLAAASGGELKLLTIDGDLPAGSVVS